MLELGLAQLPHGGKRQVAPKVFGDMSCLLGQLIFSAGFHYSLTLSSDRKISEQSQN